MDDSPYFSIPIDANCPIGMEHIDAVYKSGIFTKFYKVLCVRSPKSGQKKERKKIIKKNTYMKEIEAGDL